MKPINGSKKTARHHWWPEGVSRHWANDEGGVHWLLPDGEVKVSKPRNFGMNTNGHYIKLSSNPDEDSVWDQNFEPFFDNADSAFPSVIDWLNSLQREKVAGPLTDRFLPQPVTDDQIAILVECLLSLAIRSPKNRESAVGIAEHFRGPLPPRERAKLIAVNIRDCLKNALASVGTRGKFVVLYSPDREFIFGDGFYSNLRSPVQYSYRAKLLVPVTPEISVLYVQPIEYTLEPRLCTLVLTPEEAESLNGVVQIYSSQAVFYRSQAPAVTEHYQTGTHLEFADSGNPVDSLIAAIPGVTGLRGWSF